MISITIHLIIAYLIIGFMFYKNKTIMRKNKEEQKNISKPKTPGD
jgi:hypothetical protein